MKPARIFLIRHGQSLGNLDTDTYAKIPDYKIPLTPDGYTQAQEAGRALKREIGDHRVAFYVSPFYRTRETCAAIQTCFSSDQIDRTREDPRLREQEWGHLRVAEATDKMDAERQEYGTFFYRIPDGESGADVYDRCTGFLDTIYRDFVRESYPQNAVIVTHGFTMRVLLMRWLHWTVEEFHSLANPDNCHICELALNGDKYRLTKPFKKKSPNALRSD